MQQARLRAARGLGRHERARRPHLAARAHEGTPASNEWLKDIAPSAGLRTWFGRDPNRWREFHKRYFEAPITPQSSTSAGKVPLLFGAHDTEHNNAVALAHHLAAR